MITDIDLDQQTALIVIRPHWTVYTVPVAFCPFPKQKKLLFSLYEELRLYKTVFKIKMLPACNASLYTVILNVKLYEA